MPQHPCILLLEDNPDDAVLLCLALEESVPNVQLSVVNNQNGLQAYLRYIDEQVHQLPWLVLLDVYFPTRVDGLEALSQLRSYFMTTSRPVPVVAVSLSSQLSDIRAFYESGVSSYLVKSNDYQRLVIDCEAMSKYWFQTVSLPFLPPE